jgi:hypothetical protein
MKWIKSAGGPLICLERELVRDWHGVLAGPGLTADHSVAYLSDYGRACQVQSYLRPINVGRGSALILGDMPLETSVWNDDFANATIVRLFCCDPRTNIPELLAGIGNACFDDPVELTNFEVVAGNMIIFDSALSGSDEKKKTIAFRTPPGNYRILTSIVNPNTRTSFLLHKFFPNYVT